MNKFQSACILLVCFLFGLGETRHAPVRGGRGWPLKERPAPMVGPGTSWPNSFTVPLGIRAAWPGLASRPEGGRVALIATRSRCAPWVPRRGSWFRAVQRGSSFSSLFSAAHLSSVSLPLSGVTVCSRCSPLEMPGVRGGVRFPHPSPKSPSRP